MGYGSIDSNVSLAGCDDVHLLAQVACLCASVFIRPIAPNTLFICAVIITVHCGLLIAAGSTELPNNAGWGGSGLEQSCRAVAVCMYDSKTL